MENCLVTKLKGVVNMDNPDYLDFVILDINVSDVTQANTTLFSGNPNCLNNVVCLNDDGATISIAPYSETIVFLKVTKGSSNSVKLKVPKYDLLAMTINTGVYDIHQIQRFYSLQSLNFSYSTLPNINVSDLLGFKFLERLGITNTYTIQGTLEQIATLQTLGVLNLTNTSIRGDLAALKSLPNLQTLTIVSNPYITDNDDTVSYLRGEGVTVTYTPYSA